MILPTISMALYITWLTRKNLSELFHNIAVCCWITANSIWMTGEFFMEDGLRYYAALFFILGLVAVIIYYLFARRVHLQKPERIRQEGKS